jgi:hypothetical protein
MSEKDLQISDTLVAFDNDASTGNLIIKRTQEIPSDWIANLRKQKEGNKLTRSGNWMPVASIPVEVAEDLKRRGVIDVYTAPFREVIAVLKREGLDYFVLTNKQL